MSVDVLRRHREARRGHIESGEIGPAERATGRPRAGQVDESIERAVGPDTNDTGSASDSAIPEASLDVEARPVGSATIDRWGEDAFVREHAAAKIVSVDRVARRIGGEEAPVVRPRHRVSDAEFARRQLAHPTVTLDAIDRTAVAGHTLRRAIGMKIVLHRTDPEGAIRADAALVEPIVRQVGLNDRQSAELAAVIPQRHPVAQADDRSAVGPQADRGGKVRRGPSLVAALSKTKAMDAFAADIDPDECVAPFVVDSALADDICCVEDQSWRHLSGLQPPADQRHTSQARAL